MSQQPVWSVRADLGRERAGNFRFRRRWPGCAPAGARRRVHGATALRSLLLL